MRVLDVRQEVGDPRGLVPRAAQNIDTAEAAVRGVIDDVRLRGEEAVLDYCEKFDGVRPTQLLVPDEVRERALAELDPEVLASLTEATERVRAVHADEVPTDTVTEVAAGGFVTQRWVPVDRVGLYVPGGRAVYPSSVIMNVVPAQLAGVSSLTIASPPQAEFAGWPHPTILAAAQLLGVDEVYAAGGAQAIAWLALGPNPVTLITGPGNMWVTAAKRLLRGVVGIDSEAGPTEIMILADDSANAEFVAADLISQAEHDVVAASVLVTDSEQLITDVQRALPGQVAATKHSDRIGEALAGQQSALVLVRDLDQGLEIVNSYAAEHLEVQTRDAGDVAALVRNAGAVFVGDWSPVSLGDYCAGSNHVLPTGGCACFSSGLSVHSFMRAMHVVDYSHRALVDVAKHVHTLAYAEDLPAHAAAVDIRAERPATEIRL